jgi:L-lactate permease
MRNQLDISHLSEEHQRTLIQMAHSFELSLSQNMPPPKPIKPKIKMNRNKKKHLPMSKLEAWAVFILIGFLIILWAYVEVKNTVSDKQGTQIQSKTMMMNNTKMPQRAK